LPFGEQPTYSLTDFPEASVQAPSATPSWLPFAFLITVAATVVISKIYLARKRKLALTNVALQLGFRFEGEDWSDQSRAPQLETALFGRGGRQKEFRNIMAGDRDGFVVSFFDYTFGAGKNAVTQTVAAFTQESELPFFEVAPLDLLHKLGDTVVHKRIRFEFNPGFSDRFRLVGPDEDRIRKVFAPGLLSFFESVDEKLKWHVEGGGRTLVIYRLRKIVKAEDFPRFVDESTTMAKAFFSFSGLKGSSSE
jgi:hypothetical protein